MSWQRDKRNAKREWIGPIERYDLIQEGIIAVLVVGALVVVLAVLFGSPFVRGVTFESWAKADPKDFATTTMTELTGTSETATYGSPYNNQTGQLQSLGPISPQAWVGVRMPVDPPQDFVMRPLSGYAAFDPQLKAAVDQWNNATTDQRAAWSKAANAATLDVKDNKVTLSGGDTGPVATLLTGMLTAARTGVLTSQSIDAPDRTYSMNQTKSLLYIEDGDYLGAIASYYNLKGEQWGVMNEIGSWPGQPWLWWYSMFYNIPGWSNIGTDILAVASALPFIAIFIFLPFIPGLRSLPRWLGVYKLIWRPYYRQYGKSTEQGTASTKK